MLENIPIINKEGIESFVEQELEKVEGNAEDLLEDLDKTNPNLASAVKTIAQTTAKKTCVDEYWRQVVERKFKEVILTAIEIINQAFEAKGT